MSGVADIVFTARRSTGEDTTNGSCAVAPRLFGCGNFGAPLLRPRARCSRCEGGIARRVLVLLNCALSVLVHVAEIYVPRYRFDQLCVWMNSIPLSIVNVMGIAWRSCCTGNSDGAIGRRFR